jgi:hypothetical protein
MAGGGSIDVPDETTFWEDVNTTKPIKLKLDVSAISSGYTIYSDATAMAYFETRASFLSTTYAMHEYSSNTYMKITIMFGRYTGETRVSLVLEPLTIPDNGATLKL